ncbi:MAG: hypothetical protein EOS18_31390 [Mesorhizobium sp.]|nr:MAG: hypothetical protein EOS18_31390 [Mesorhizobium sp.]
MLGALMALDCLPRRDTALGAVHLESFRVALEGKEPGVVVVAHCDLVAAVRKVIQGALGHAFHPSPAELRMICNAAMEERTTEADRELRRQRELEERRSLRLIYRTDEQRARAAEITRRFHEQIEANCEADEIEAIRVKYDPAELAQIPDAPVDATWRRGGGR